MVVELQTALIAIATAFTVGGLLGVALSEYLSNPRRRDVRTVTLGRASHSRPGRGNSWYA